MPNGTIICSILAVVCIIISILQFKEKGFLFNNAFIWASEQERETMDKKPYYRQSGIVFAFLSSVFVCIGIECTARTGWLWWMIGALLALVLIYAVVSSIREDVK